MSTPDPAPDLVALLQQNVVDVPDFPEPGVVFKDITPLLADRTALAAAIGGLRDQWWGAGRPPVDVVVGIEARGFLFGTAVACAAGTGFVPLRKAGKLPRATFAQSYDLEYGTAELEVHRDAVTPGQRVLVVDDVLATGGTAVAAAALLERAGAQVAGIAVLVELACLGGRARLAAAAPQVPLSTLLTY